MGTSLKVYPFAGLVEKVTSRTPRVLINMTRAGNFETNPEYNYRDVLALGDLQETTWKIVKLLAWEVSREGGGRRPKSS
jgi:NAD-dependent SIR2 family protein deacetylase